MSNFTLPELFDSLPPAALIKGIQDERLRREAESKGKKKAELIRDDFAVFVREAWYVVEHGRALAWNWHHDILADELSALTTGANRRLRINIPPRTSKSTFAKMLQPWVWLQDPETEQGAKSGGWSSTWYCWSHSKDLANADNVAARRLVQSDWYREQLMSLYGMIPWELQRDENRITRFSNTAGGTRQAHAVNAGGTGWGGDYLIGDDPHDGNKVMSEADRNQAIDYWRNTLPTRENDPITARWLIMGQRTHAQDLFGWITEHEPGYWREVCIPMRHGYAPEESAKHPDDPRTERGQLLWPERMTREWLDRVTGKLGDNAPAQLDQNPRAEGGNILQAVWLDAERWRHLPGPDEFRRVIAYFDLTFGSMEKTASGNCVWVVGEIQWRDRLCYMLMDRRWERGGGAVQDGMIVGIQNQWKAYRPAMLVEKKAEGRRAVEGLVLRMPALRAVEPPKGNIADRKVVAFRAAVEPIARAGQLILPADDVRPWVTEVRRILLDFPKVKPDDDADCASGALWELWAGEQEMSPDDILVW